jgi:glycosyltransferase involved in cell wall biosynthesis
MYNIGFVLEQVLGHITHSRNLQANVAQDPDVRAHWALVDFDVGGAASYIPLYRNNWTVRAGIRAVRQLQSITRSTKLDAVLFHTQIPAIFARRWLNTIPGIVSLDATPMQYDALGQFYDHKRGSAVLERLKWRMNRDCYKAARHLIVWSAWTKQGLIDDYEVPADKITVVPPGVNLGEWQRPSPRVVRSGPVKILFVGGSLERKGGHLLLEAFRSLRHLDVELHLVTKSAMAQEPGLFVYSSMAPNSKELKALYYDCDIFALPTYGDCLPMVLSEAGAAGMAIITTNIAGIPEIIQDGITGLTIEPGDTQALTEGLRRLIGDRELRMKLGANAVEHVARAYDAESNAVRVVDMLKSEADRARSTSGLKVRQ